MFSNLIAFSLRRPGFVLALAAALLALAVYGVPRMPVDVFPELNAPTVVVLTECGGLAADEVERNVTFPIESAVRSVAGVRRVRSSSSIGLSLLWVEFDWGEDIYRARMQVGERLAAARESLPPDVHSEMTPITSITGEIMLLSLSSPGGELSPMEVRSYAQYELRNQLLGVPGVAQIAVIGGELAEYQVLVRQDRLRAHDLALTDVVAAARGAHTTAAAGYLPDVGGLELPVRQTGRVRSVEDIRGTVVRFRDGRAITIGDVADVQVGPAPRRGTAADGGNPAVVLGVQKAPGTNTLLLTAAVDELLDRVEPTLPAGLKLNRHVMRQSDFIQIALDNLLHVLRDAAIFVAIVLLLFLLDVRTTAITLAAIPLSLAVALLTLWALGMSINVMTLGGLAVAIGGLVDDAIIDVENVLRRLRENAALPAGERLPIVQAVLRASNEIRTPMVYATVLVTMVFLPLLFLQGLEGRFFQPLGVAFLVSTAASLVVALTVTPALALLLLRDRPERAAGGALQRGFARLQDLLFAHPAKLAVAVLLFCAVGVEQLRHLGGEFVPPFREGHFVAQLDLAPGTSLPQMREVGRKVCEALLATGHIATVEQQIGRAELGEDPWPQNRSEFHIELVPMPGAQEAEVEDEIRAVFESVPGGTSEVLTFLGDRLGETLTGETADVVVTVFGEDLDRLDGAAAAVLARLRGVPGLVDARVGTEPGQPQVEVRLRPRDLVAAGVDARQVRRVLAMACQGLPVAQVLDGLRLRDVVVTVAGGAREDVAALASLQWRTADGRAVSLPAVADIDLVHGRASIQHEGGRRRQVVTANIDGRAADAVAADVQRALATVAVPAGVTVTQHGAIEARAEAGAQLLEGSLLVGIAVLVILRTAFRSLRNTLLVLVNLPFTFVGGVLALRLFGGGLDMGALVGFVTLFGITTRNSIMLLSHYEHLVAKEGHAWDLATAVLGARERFAPILMTALVTGLALLPLAVQSGAAGREIEGPMAGVILGGLATSTLLNLFVLPGLALRFGRFGRVEELLEPTH
ncbi:MAG: efflux RND transporter permease subunit [Planctomycetes bacterium]|nr:efflux RND transporter permease subunit [Planctomycetota bacterium]